MDHIVAQTRLLIARLGAATLKGNTEEVVDLAGDLDYLRDVVESGLDKAKDYLRDQSGNEHPIFRGQRFTAKVSPNPEDTIDPYKFQSWLKREGLIRHFWNFIKVRNTEAKDFFGERVLKEITTRTFKKRRVTFSKLSKKR